MVAGNFMSVRMKKTATLCVNCTSIIIINEKTDTGTLSPHANNKLFFNSFTYFFKLLTNLKMRIAL